MKRFYLQLVLVSLLVALLLVMAGCGEKGDSAVQEASGNSNSCDWVGTGDLNAVVGVILELMEEMGKDIYAHSARQIHPDMVRAADLVLVMESGHKRAIDDADPTARGKVHRLGEWQDRDIPDPYRQPRRAFEEGLHGWDWY